MTDLPDDIPSLKGLIQRLLDENVQLKAENAELKAENAQLKAEIAELRSRLGQNSANSHKPPSSDGYKKKTTRPGVPKEGNKRRGGQHGHQGNTLKRVEHPDHLEVHRPQQCTCCGRTFTAEEAQESSHSRQVFDLPPPKLEVTEHRLACVECCGQSHLGTYPAQVTAPVQYGPGVYSLVTTLSIDHRMPLEQISRLFADQLGYELNSTTIENALRLGYERAEPLEQQTIAAIKQEGLAHFDESGLRVEGRLQWLHVASTEHHTHLFLHEKRGKDALDSSASILREFSGIAVHDCWSPYFEVTEARHVLCGAHLLRELQGLWENGSRWAEDMHGFLLKLYRTPRPLNDAEQARVHYRLILDRADQQEPHPPPRQPGQRGRVKQSKGRNLLDRLRQHEQGVLAFAFKPSIPFTNNQAERDLRPAKVKQKVSGGFRTQAGARVYVRLQAVISTLRKQNINVFKALRNLFSGLPITAS